jgi:hypothetical protein
MALSTADRLEIQDLVARYNTALDGGGIDAWVSLFAGEQSLTVSTGTYVGAKQLAAFALGFLAKFSSVRHLGSNLVIEGDGNLATMSSYLQVIDVSDGVRFIATGFYRDQLVKVDGRWRFSVRVLHRD